MTSAFGAAANSLGQSLDPMRISQTIQHFNAVERRRQDQDFLNKDFAAMNKRAETEPGFKRIYEEYKKVNTQFNPENVQEFKRGRDVINAAAEVDASVDNALSRGWIDEDEAKFYKGMALKNTPAARQYVTRAMHDFLRKKKSNTTVEARLPDQTFTPENQKMVDDALARGDTETVKQLSDANMQNTITGNIAEANQAEQDEKDRAEMAEVIKVSAEQAGVSPDEMTKINEFMELNTNGGMNRAAALAKASVDVIGKKKSKKIADDLKMHEAMKKYTNEYEIHKNNPQVDRASFATSEAFASVGNFPAANAAITSSLAGGIPAASAGAQHVATAKANRIQLVHRQVLGADLAKKYAAATTVDEQNLIKHNMRVNLQMTTAEINEALRSEGGTGSSRRGSGGKAESRKEEQESAEIVGFISDALDAGTIEKGMDKTERNNAFYAYFEKITGVEMGDERKIKYSVMLDKTEANVGIIHKHRKAAKSEAAIEIDNLTEDYGFVTKLKGTSMFGFADDVIWEASHNGPKFKGKEFLPKVFTPAMGLNDVFVAKAPSGASTISVNGKGSVGGEFKRMGKDGLLSETISRDDIKLENLNRIIDMSEGEVDSHNKQVVAAMKDLNDMMVKMSKSEDIPPNIRKRLNMFAVEAYQAAAKMHAEAGVIIPGGQHLPEGPMLLPFIGAAYVPESTFSSKPAGMEDRAFKTRIADNQTTLQELAGRFVHAISYDRDLSGDIVSGPESKQVFPGRYPLVENENGPPSNVKTITVGFGDRTFVLPTMENGQQLTEDQAVELAQKNGLRNYPSFTDPEEAKAFSIDIHDKVRVDGTILGN